MNTCNFCSSPIADGFIITHTFRGPQLCICKRCTGIKDDLTSFIRGMTDITLTKEGDVVDDYDDCHGNIYVKAGIEILDSLARVGYCEEIMEV